MGFRILKNEINNWCDLSNYSGEGLLYCNSGNGVVAKVHAVSASISAMDAVRAYKSRLRDEVVITDEKTQCWSAGLMQWCTIVFELNKGKSYSIFSYTIIDARLCTIDAVMMSIEDLQMFKTQFDSIVSGIDFSLLCDEFGTIKCGDSTVMITSISDVCLQSSLDNTLIFIGKSKYIVVTTNVGMHHDLIEHAKDELDLIHVRARENRDVYQFLGGSTGIIEIKLINTASEQLEVFAYYSNGSESCIEDNLVFSVLEDNYAKVS